MFPNKYASLFNFILNIYMKVSAFKWMRIVLFNLLIVAFLGCILRYKIAFSLTFINQKYLLHGHSHFAFSGWITQILMVLILLDISKYAGKNLIAKYNKILIANLIAAYGMLLTFPIQGYGIFSISFSILSTLIFYWFSYIIFVEIKNIKKFVSAFYWYKASISLGLLSTLGTFTLAFLMTTLQKSQNAYLLSLYEYLHFQYNGWFFFALMGLLISKIELFIISNKILKKIFWMFFLSCFPAYFLSVLWLPIPNWAFIIVILAALIQTWALFDFWKIIIQVKDKFSTTLNPGKLLLLLSLIALSIKIFLQLFSTIPILSQIAFGYRSIVVGYLHLIFLGVITIGIFGYLLNEGIIILNKIQLWGLWTFIIGIILNQVVLFLQGVSGLFYLYIPFLNQLLFLMAIVMFSGLIILVFNSQEKRKIEYVLYENHHKFVFI